MKYLIYFLILGALLNNQLIANTQLNSNHKKEFECYQWELVEINKSLNSSQLKFIDSSFQDSSMICIYQTIDIETASPHLNVVYIGEFTTEGDSVAPENAMISVVESETGLFVGQYNPRKSDGRFLMILEEGVSYKVTYIVDNKIALEEKLIVPEGTHYKKTYKTIRLSPVQLAQEVNLQLESKSKLSKMDSNHLEKHVATIAVNDSGGTFKYEPLGILESRFVFK